MFRLYVLPRSTQIQLIAWIVVVFLQPILQILGWNPALFYGIQVMVLFQAGVVSYLLVQAWGIRRAGTTILIVLVTAYLAEQLGTASGFPFGKYHYTDLLQPQAWNIPLVIPLAWLMMLPPAWTIARLITGKDGRAPMFVLASALAFTAWDLFLDPQMVGWKFWQWETPGFYFGIPLVNYFGWLIVSGLITWLAAPRDLPTEPLAFIYTATWFLQTVALAAFWGKPGPAVFGFFGMGIPVLIAIFWNFRTKFIQKVETK
jgi:putative membrane protein